MLEPTTNLTARERDVLALVLADQTNAEMAAELGVSPNTVKTHVQRLLAKFEASSKRELRRKITRSG